MSLMRDVMLAAGIVAFVIGAGCTGIGQDETEPTVLALNGGQIDSPALGGAFTNGNRNANTNGNTNGSPGGGGTGNSNAPATYTTRTGRVLLIACRPTQSDVDCSEPGLFACQQDAQDYLNALIAAGLGDCHELDGPPSNGLACDGVLRSNCNAAP